MILDCAKLLAEAAEEIGMDIEIRQDYSGRGMYGSKTTAIVLESGSVSSAWSKLAVLAAVAGKNTADDTQAFEALTVGLDDLRSDAMGRDGVVLY